MMLRDPVAEWRAFEKVGLRVAKLHLTNALALPKPAEEVAEAMLGHGILAGWPLGRLDDARANQLLVCATEKRTQSDIAAYAAALREVLA